MANAYVKNDNFNEYEITNKRASYRTIVENIIGDIVLCNDIPYLDDSVYDNAEFMEYDDEEEYTEIYQWYLCNLDSYSRTKAIESGLLISYSNMLNCDILCVDHYGTSWDYVLTDVPIFETWEEWEAYMYGDSE